MSNHPYSHYLKHQVDPGRGYEVVPLIEVLRLGVQPGWEFTNESASLWLPADRIAHDPSTVCAYRRLIGF